jgi:hypothetical protein
MKRKKVAIIIATEPDFNIQALQYFFLSINKIQNLFEFTFPEIEDYIFTEEDKNGEKIIDKLSENHSALLRDYNILIMTTELLGDYFSVSNNNISVITTHDWQKRYAPPSLFEFLLNSSVACLLCMDKRLDLGYHSDTCGCVMDYTEFKEDARVDTVMGYICDDDKEYIKKKAGKKYLEQIETMVNREWIGSLTELHSVAYNLKSYFKFDIEKDSGLNKTTYERIKESLFEIPQKVVLLIITSIITAIITIILTVLGLTGKL